MRGSRPRSPKCFTPPGSAARRTSSATSWRMPASTAAVSSPRLSAGTAFVQEDGETARAQWRQVADQLRPKVPKLAGLMDAAEADVLAFISFPESLPSRRPGITGRRSPAPTRSNASMERSSAAPKPAPAKAGVVGIFPHDAAITRLVDAILLEQNDEWAVQRARYIYYPAVFLRSFRKCSHSWPQSLI